jgi:hypothetical protein
VLAPHAAGHEKISPSFSHLLDQLRKDNQTDFLMLHPKYFPVVTITLISPSPVRNMTQNSCMLQLDRRWLPAQAQCNALRCYRRSQKSLELFIIINTPTAASAACCLHEAAEPQHMAATGL